MSEWTRIPGYGDRYQIWPDGQIFSEKHRKFLTPTRDKDGYWRVSVYDGSEQVTTLVHRLVALSFLPPPKPEQAHVRHLNGDQNDNHVFNLAHGTAAENAADMARHGTHHQIVKTHCKNGHEFTPENTRRRPGGRSCLACERQRTTCGHCGKEMGKKALSTHTKRFHAEALEGGKA